MRSTDGPGRANMCWLPFIFFADNPGLVAPPFLYEYSVVFDSEYQQFHSKSSVTVTVLY